MSCGLSVTLSGLPWVAHVVFSIQPQNSLTIQVYGYSSVSLSHELICPHFFVTMLQHWFFQSGIPRFQMITEFRLGMWSNNEVTSEVANSYPSGNETWFAGKSPQLSSMIFPFNIIYRGLFPYVPYDFPMFFPLKKWLPEGITMAARSRTIDSLTVSNGSQGWGSAGKVHCNGCGIVLVIISTLAILLSMWWWWWWLWCFVGVGVGAVAVAVAVAVVAAAYHPIPYYDILYYCYF